MSSVLALSSVRLQVFARSIQRLLSTEGKSKYSEEYFKEAVGKRNMVVFMKGIPSEPMVKTMIIFLCYSINVA
jgi:hypothetical protein